MTVPLQRKTRNLFTVVAFIPALLAAALYISRQEYQRSSLLVTHTREVQSEIDDLLSDVTTAETAQRGYLLTGREEYLAPYIGMRADTMQKWANLRRLTSDNPNQQQMLSRLLLPITAKFDVLQRTVDLKRAHNDRDALELVASKTGLELMNTIRRVCKSLNAQEDLLLAQRIQATAMSEKLVTVSVVGLVLASLFLIGWAARVINAFTAESEHTQSAIQDLNERLRLRIGESEELNRRLEERVAQRTVELQDANLNLSRSNADLEHFAYVASHDLQEPLRMVASYVELLRRRYGGQLDSRADEYIGYAVDGAKRMQRLIEDLLSYSRASTQALGLETTDLNPLLNEALLNLQQALEQSNADVRRQQLPTLRVDPVKLVQVFQNLISNAIKFRDAARPLVIQVSAQSFPEGWRISISDNGEGFDPKFVERIFILFQRLDVAARHTGTGIGLAVCKRIVEAHGGRIWAESQPGAGSSFHFTLSAPPPASSKLSA